MTIEEIQRALVERGYDLGPWGPKKDGVDGQMGKATRAAIEAFQRANGLAVTGGVDIYTAIKLTAPAPLPKGFLIPPSWMPNGRLERIIMHWTAGSHTASGLDKEHYHILIEGNGNLIKGKHPISANAIGAVGARASHTLNCNTGSIGVSLCCMRGATERPWNPGPSPMTAMQVEALAQVCADLCRRYGIPVTQRTVLSHAEVGQTLGIKQRGKWDYTWLAGMARPEDPVAVGDRIRHAVFTLISK